MSNSEDKFDFKILAKKTNKDILGDKEEEKDEKKLEVKSRRQTTKEDIRPKNFKNGMDISEFAKSVNKGDQKIYKPNY